LDADVDAQSGRRRDGLAWRRRRGKSDDLTAPSTFFAPSLHRQLLSLHTVRSCCTFERAHFQSTTAEAIQETIIYLLLHGHTSSSHWHRGYVSCELHPSHDKAASMKGERRRTPVSPGQAKDLCSNDRSLKCRCKTINTETETSVSQRRRIMATPSRLVHMVATGWSGGVRGIELGVVGKSMSECSRGGVYRELSAVARRSSSSECKSRIFMRSRAGEWGALLSLRTNVVDPCRQSLRSRHRMVTCLLRRNTRSSCWAPGWAAQ
jgi:hypothetical protein